MKRSKETPPQPSGNVPPAVSPAMARLAAFAAKERGVAPPPMPAAAPARPAAAAPVAKKAATGAPASHGHEGALQKAVDLFTFLRELVSLRTTVVRNSSSYDRVLWIDQVPKEPECESSFRAAKDDETRDWWLHVRKPNFVDPPAPPESLIPWVDPEQIVDSALESPRPLDKTKPAQNKSGEPTGAAEKLSDHPDVKPAWDRYVETQWRPWAEEDRRKRRVLRIYTDLFSLYQQQKELGESYEVIIALGQLRWSPKANVEVNRHVVAVQTNVEFDSQKGVITVGPAADGAKPRLEEDMLELDERPAPDVLTALEQQVAACDDDIWHNDQMVNALKSFVHSLGSGQGTYSDELTPLDRGGAAPQMRFAPAIILRRRTEQGLLQVYGKILEDLKKRTDLPEGLIPLVEVGWQTRESQVAATAAANGHGASHALLFPLHFNDEQLQIVHRLQHQCGVVVQGPPGTGKSHTIANLVCHLLATGNRVLVTSHAPRALRILKDKIPQAITNMCVVLLGNDRTAMTELEQSVQVITQQLNAWDPLSREASIKELEGKLAALYNRADEVDTALRAIRESDTHKHPEMPGGYSGTLQHIAEVLRSRQEKYGWVHQFKDGVDFEALQDDVGMLNQEAVELLRGLRGVDVQRRKDLERELPVVADAMTPEALERLIEEEGTWRSAAEQAKAAAAGEAPMVPPDLEADQGTLRELCDLIDTIVKQNGDMEAHYFPWVPKMARDIRAGQVDQWRVLLEKTQPHIAAIRHQPEQVFELEVIGTGDNDIHVVRDDAKLLAQHVKNGGRITKLFRYVSPAAERQYIFRFVQINGMRVKGLKMLQALRMWAEVQVELHSLAQLWTDIAEQPHGPVVRRLPVWGERCSIIATALQMHDLILKAKHLYQRLPDVQPVAWHDPEKLRALQKQLKAVLAQKEFGARRQSTDTIAEQAARRAAKKGAHPVGAKIAESIQRRNLEGYKIAYAQLGELWAEREKWAQTGTLLKQLATRLPAAAEALSDDPGEEAWDLRLSKLQEAWFWFRADCWLKRQLDPRHFEHLQAERKGLQEQLQAAMVKLAAAKAWYYCMQRMTPTEETYLKAWMQAVRNIGAGTGKRADRFRKVARQTLEKCRSAIPAWIMPIHRLAETVTPGEDQFDVVIVDEASQSGAEALFLHYIAKKIIIVGDDKQIAPYNVGINRDDVELLRHRHIKDLPLSDYFDLEHSFFDQAYLRFGNRIRLCEHFRCMPEIIQFSNKLCYSNEPLLPLRQYGDGRIEPVVVAKHVSGHMEGTSPTVSNKAEADAIVKTIAKLVADPLYKEKTFGVISMLGEKQARMIEEKLLKAIGPEEIERRRLICGDAYSFQGDERNVMFISLVVAPDEGRRLATLTQAADERRFNVAASRARDQMWLFHSVNPDDLSPKCLRRQFLEYCLNPQVPEDTGEHIATEELEELAGSADRSRVPAPQPFKSWLEVDVFLQISHRGYRVLPQHAFAGYRIDLVVTGTHGRLAVECDGADWHGPERYDNDMERQRQFERCGWRFWRIRGGTFYRNPDTALDPLWELLEKQGIEATEEEADETPAVLQEAKADAADVEPEVTPRKAAAAKRAKEPAKAKAAPKKTVRKKKA